MNPSGNRQARGRRAEALARDWLQGQGFVIEATNVRSAVGEIDIVAREGATLCFIEVRSSQSTAWGDPAESVRARKQQRLLRAAQWYLAGRAEQPPAIRFDVLALRGDGASALQPDLVRGAFDASALPWRWRL